MVPEDELTVLTSAVKMRRESIALYEKGGRPELVEQEGRELAIIQEYLPPQLSPNEISNVIDEVVTHAGALTTADLGPW